MISSIIADVDVDVDEPWGLFCFRQCLLIINRIKTEVPPGSWIWYLEAHLGSKRPTGLLPLDEEIFACQVDLFTLYDIIHSWHLAAYTWLIKLKGEICPSRHCRWQCKIFASGVNFSIFTIFCILSLKLLKLAKIGGVKVLARKSGSVRFWKIPHVWIQFCKLPQEYMVTNSREARAPDDSLINGQN